MTILIAGLQWFGPYIYHHPFPRLSRVCFLAHPFRICDQRLVYSSLRRHSAGQMWTVRSGYEGLATLLPEICGLRCTAPELSRIATMVVLRLPWLWLCVFYHTLDCNGILVLLSHSSMLTPGPPLGLVTGLCLAAWFGFECSPVLSKPIIHVNLRPSPIPRVRAFYCFG